MRRIGFLFAIDVHRYGASAALRQPDSPACGAAYVRSFRQNQDDRVEMVHAWQTRNVTPAEHHAPLCIARIHS
jgi:hypothetical protein